ncbi:MAG TPA: peptide-methionine (R)-S-oxide reductase MsrB, partial [Patescibacteria group bacterium]|nr:peptide-methionine (R)-S-oxide reductase MsrB [Patescibacteria group bacterium]
SYWRNKLTPDQYRILREKGTDPAFANAYYHKNDAGMYVCAACGQELFSSATKFDSGSGWPSFDNPVNSEHIELVTDNSHGMIRTEVRCKNCGSHLGHLFPDGPTPTGQRYCINSTSLSFKKATPGAKI